MSALLQKTLPGLHKIKPLDGTNYKPWCQKLLLYFEQLEIDYVLSTKLPDENNAADSTDPFTPAILKTPSIPLDEATKYKPERDNKLAWSYLLNHTLNPFFDLFVAFKSVKTIWTILEAKYGSHDARKKKYVVGKWL